MRIQSPTSIQWSLGIPTSWSRHSILPPFLFVCLFRWGIIGAAVAGRVVFCNWRVRVVISTDIFIQFTGYGTICSSGNKNTLF